ncbi:M28 family metallopeptidase [Alloacidobacterium dinghuense]|uniref:M28 family metallopeptidase n=1 Tax=Alloacidobacterium dinghuense TaxID=2763107 RepID=A0A7G8BM29_9BACT|nr:M28 family metallopeptidase [Alloacidobacterium dinghuense]QNI33599.1 M28 family metallopeptidase [Alloacidobacterium dinghuense]
MTRRALASSLCLSALAVTLSAQNTGAPQSVFGYPDFSAQAKIDQQFLAVPDAKLAGEELKTLTAAPHIAGSKEDHDTALYVAEKFKAAGLDTSIVTYKAWMNLPKEIHVTATDANGKVLMNGPTPEHVDGDPFDDDPRVVTAFNGSSPSGDVTAEVVYANYGRPEDFKKLDDLGISVKGKIVLTRYGGNFRGVKVYIAQERGAAGVIIYSDPADDGYFKGDKYPKGPYRPDTGVQRGAVQYLFKYPGDASTPGTASTPDLPESQRLNPATAPNMPQIPSTPISYHDAAPILAALTGPNVPHEWQGALPFAYHVGPGGVKVHMDLKQDFAYRDIWDVIGKIPGTDWPDDWVVAGNHRDAWVYGAVDPNSGTAAMLEAVHGIGALLKSGWKPKRTIIFGSWDAEEEGLIGSTEWAEDNAAALSHAVAYFNTDVGVAGPNFDASAVPSLKEFVRVVTKEVPAAKGGNVYDAWKKSQSEGESRRHSANEHLGQGAHQNPDVEIGDLGSGSDYTPFIQHLGVPSTDIGSSGPYGVYHSVFDNYNWFIKNADPTFIYEQQQARVFGIEILHMADTDVLPYDYVTYGKEITEYLEAAKKKADESKVTGLDFAPALAAAKHFTAAAEAVYKKQQSLPANPADLNTQLRQVEGDLLSQAGLPNRTWYKHTIYAPGEYTGYAAVVIPGVNEAIDAKDSARGAAQLTALTEAINRAASTLETAAK